MTVGIGAICENDTDDAKVVISSDRMVTTIQQSRIEHEHPETKLIEFGDQLGNTHLVGIVAGSIQLGEMLERDINMRLAKFQDEHGEDPWVSTAADIAGQAYRSLVQERIQNGVLSPYGLELEDLSRQHQFQDEFLNDVLSEVNEMQGNVTENLNLLMGGVGEQGVGIYQIAFNDVIPQNDLGYATIGSGTQPAESEFIQIDYGKSSSLDTALATVAAAHDRAKDATGVGGQPDIIVIDSDGVHEVPNGVRDDLMDRQETIAEEQEDIRRDILTSDTVDWDP